MYNKVIWLSLLFTDHYKNLASQFDTHYEVHCRAKCNFIEKVVPLKKDDHIVDIGGGTAQLSLMIHSDLGMTKQVVCVDPSPEMLEIAQKKGAITIQATGENFLASKPDYSLKVVLMTSCVHHFKDPDLKLAEYMPEDGVCIVTEYI